MNDFDAYIAKVRQHARKRMPLTAAEKQCLRVYLGIVVIASIVAFVVR